jgi:outer membrane protein assembly factor BamE (lipoprotein component of BamABCDE complex)
MKKITYFLIFIFIANCSLNKVVKHHGVPSLDKKEKKLTLSSSNTNDITKLLGPPSTKSSFDNDVWIYIERKTTNSSRLLDFGQKKILINNILILEIDNKGLLVKKDFFDINDMEKIKFSKEETELTYSKRSFVYDFLSSLRQKANDPLGKRKRKREF